MKTIYRWSLFLFIFWAGSCSEDEPVTGGYPRLNTVDVSDVSTSGATFDTEFTYRGDHEILEYGFVWSDDTNPTRSYSEEVVFSGNIQSGNFSAVVSATFSPHVRYYARPFVQTADYLVYGQIVNFDVDE